jgi:hypothetical protein
VTTVADIVLQSQQRATADRKWLGSASHLTFLEASLEQTFHVTDVTLRWERPGEPSVWTHAAREIGLERPVVTRAVTAEDAAELTALGLLHESLHARFSPELGLFRERHPELLPTMASWAGLMFQRLEDGRAAYHGLQANPEFAEPLARHAAKTLVFFGQQAAARGSGSTVAPQFQDEQLAFALQSYCIAPDTSFTLHPRVERRLETLKESIDQARAGTSEECDELCVKLAKAIVAFQ